MQDITNVPDFLKRAADKIGHTRERFTESNIPTTFDNVAITGFYGDMRGEFVMSTMLLHRLKELHPSKYLILCSYPGRAGLYPYVDEYWGMRDETAVRELLDSAVGMTNLNEDRVLFQTQQMNRYFGNVIDLGQYANYYNDGFTKDFFDKFKWITYNLPSVPSSKIEFNRSLALKPGYKVMIYPSRVCRAWSKGREVIVRSRIEFWHALARKMLDGGFQPVVCQDHGTFDLSKEFETKCIYVTESRMSDVMGTMRTTGCVLDVFSGISHMAAVARTPFVACAERTHFNKVKEWELTSLCNHNLPHRYIFGFPTIIESGFWGELADTITSKLSEFIPELNRDEWPSTAEQSAVAPYSLVRKRKAKKIGSRFIKVQKM